MRRSALLATIAVVLAALAVVPVAGLGAGGGVVAQADENATAANETGSDVAPGQRLTGVLGVQEAEVNAEVESRSFGIQVARAASDDARAAVVADKLSAVEKRIDEFEQRKEELERARENGSLSEGAYRAQVATLAAENAGVDRLTNQSANASAGLPADLLESHGINASAIQTLKERADELGGQEVAAIARDIAGPGVGGPPSGAGPPEGVPGDGRPDDAGSDGGANAGNQSSAPTPDGSEDEGDERGNGPPAEGDRGQSGDGDGDDTATATEADDGDESAGGAPGGAY